MLNPHSMLLAHVLKALCILEICFLFTGALNKCLMNLKCLNVNCNPTFGPHCIISTNNTDHHSHRLIAIDRSIDHLLGRSVALLIRHLPIAIDRSPSRPITHSAHPLVTASSHLYPSRQSIVAGVTCPMLHKRSSWT